MNAPVWRLSDATEDVDEVVVSGVMSTDGRLRLRSPLDVVAWAEDHLRARLVWESMLPGFEIYPQRSPAMRVQAGELEMHDMIQRAVRVTFVARVDDRSYVLWAVVGLDYGRQVEFLDRAWYELQTQLFRRGDE